MRTGYLGTLMALTNLITLEKITEAQKMSRELYKQIEANKKQ